ncbi:MAG: Fic family protein [Cyanobacteria bacterium P01_D01_bin.14]
MPFSTATRFYLGRSAAQLYDDLLQWLKAHPHDRISAILSKRILVNEGMDLFARLKQIDQLKTWLDSFRPLSPGVMTELKQRYDVRFTYTSNAIEGNTLTQSETALVLSKGITIGGKTLAEHLEVVGHKEAIDYIETLAQTDTPIGEWEIRQIHSLIVRKLSPPEAGEYRQLDVRAAGTDHVYPPHYLLLELMTAFVQWLATPPKGMHPVVYATEAHYRFVSIHPFRDGNGRTGRLLMNLLLLKAGFPIVVISNQQRQVYIAALNQAQQAQDDLTALLDLVLAATRESLIETLAVLATSAESRGNAHPFYDEVVAFLSDL